MLNTNTTGEFNGLSENTYAVLVTDGNDCTQTIENIILTEPENPITIENFTIESIATYCLDNGSISAEISGGCGVPYTIAIYNSDENGTLLTLNSTAAALKGVPS